MPTKVEKVRSIKTIKFISFDKLLWEKETRTVVNPFSNLLEMLECYCSIADKQDMGRLKIFVKKSQSEENDSYISHLDMYSEFITSMFWNSIDPDEENNWMNFDIQRLEEMLQNPFFTEYNLSRKQLENCIMQDIDDYISRIVQMSVRQYIPSGSCSNSAPESNIESLWIGCE